MWQCTGMVFLLVIKSLSIKLICKFLIWNFSMHYRVYFLYSKLMCICRKLFYLYFATTSRRLTCMHAKLFPTVKRRTCIHVLRHYSRNLYCNFGRYAIFRTKGTANNNRAHPFIQHLFLCPTSQEEDFCVGKFGRVVDQAVLENQPLCKHFKLSRLR